jgi:uncharacterized protein
MKQKLERKIAIVTKATAGDEGTGSFEGYGSTFGHVDSYGDRIVEGAYKDTIPDFLKRGGSLLSHDWMSLPIGTITEAKEDAIGLYLVSHYHSIQSAQDARTVAKERIDRGANVGLSIGYLARDWKYVREDGSDWPIRELLAIDLFEISQVLVPADSFAGMTGVKSGIPFVDEAEELVTSVESFVKRTQAIHALRAKDGRDVSTASKDRVQEVAEKLALLNEELTAFGKTPPVQDSSTIGEKVQAMKMRSMRVQHLLRSVG